MFSFFYKIVGQTAFLQSYLCPISDFVPKSTIWQSHLLQNAVSAGPSQPSHFIWPKNQSLLRRLWLFCSTKISHQRWPALRAQTGLRPIFTQPQISNEIGNFIGIWGCACKRCKNTNFVPKLSVFAEPTSGWHHPSGESSFGWATFFTNFVPKF